MGVKNFIVALLLFSIAFAEFGIVLTPTGTIEDDQLESIKGIFYANGKIYIISPDISGYFIYTIQGNDMDKKTYEELNGLRDIFVDDRGYMYFTKGSSIWKRAPSLKQVRSYDGAYGIWKLEDKFYLTDSKENRVVVMADDGAVINFIGEKGQYNLMFDSPKGIFYDDGKFYIADDNNRRVQVMYENLTLHSMCGQTNIMMQSAYDVFVDADYVYVADKKGGQVVWFTKDCYPVFAYTISDPVGVWVVDDKMYIAQENGKIQTFNYERLMPLQYIFLKIKEYFDDMEYYEQLYYIGKDIGVQGTWDMIAAYDAIQARYEEDKPGEAYFYFQKFKSYNLLNETKTLENAISARMLSLAQGRWNEDEIVDAVESKDFEHALELLETEQPPPPPLNVSKEEPQPQPEQNVTKVPKEAFTEVEQKIANPPPFVDYTRAEDYYKKALEYEEKDPALAYSYLQSANSLIEEENKKTSVYPLLALLGVVVIALVGYVLFGGKKKR